MELTAVQSVVFKKLEEMMKGEPMICQNLEEITEEFRSFVPGSEGDKEKYLDIVYGVEDAIESFFLQMECRRNRFGFLMDKWCLYLFNCFTRTRLTTQMAQFKDEIKKLKVGNTNATTERSAALVKIESVQNQEAEIKSLNFGVGNGTKSQRSLAPYHVGSIQKQDHDGEDRDVGYGNGTTSQRSLAPNHAGSVQNLDHDGEDRDEVNALPYARFISGVSFRKRSINRQQQKTLTFSKSYDEDVDELVDVLTRNDNFVIPILGVPGSGKTTLASKIYKTKDMKKHFDCHAYVFVAKEYKTKDILLCLLKEVGNLKEQKTPIPDEVHNLGDRLLEHLEKKRYLVVLEDVREICIWEELQKYLRDYKNGSKIILTSSIPDVRASLEKGWHHDLKPLSDKASWEIFLLNADWRERPSWIDDKLKKIILAVCAGLPVNIVLLSGLISTEKTLSETDDKWTQLLSNQENWDTDGILSFSYEKLPSHLMLCLLYMALFPRDFDIPVRRLLRLWHAEGFIQGSSDKQKVKQPEDVVQRYFDELVSRRMIKISKWRSDDTARRCRLLGVLHDKLLPKAQSFRLLYVHRNSDEVKKSVRRIGDHAGCKKIDDKFQGLRSYLSFNFPKKDTPAEGVGNFLKQIIGNGYLLLRVLDLEGVYKPTLPDNLGELYNLRYLGLRWTYVDSIPPSVGDLVYLETLDVKHTYINSLPISIWKLKQLQNLNLNENQLDMPMEDASLSKLNLLTLWGLFLNAKIPVKNGWDRLSHLRELGISFDETLSQDDLLSWIQGLTDLRSLRLRSNDYIGRPLKLLLKPLSKLLNLLTLNLVGKIEKLPEQCFPPNVKVLTLSFSRLKEDPMETLGKLSSLKVLRLLAESFIGTELDCHGGGFPKLRVLKLWMLKLEHFKVAEGTMENLEELNIRRCDKLKDISATLLEQEKLVEITLVNMPLEFTAKIKDAAGNACVNADTDWKFTSLPWEDENTSKFYK